MKFTTLLVFLLASLALTGCAGLTTMVTDHDKAIQGAVNNAGEGIRQLAEEENYPLAKKVLYEYCRGDISIKNIEKNNLFQCLMYIAEFPYQLGETQYWNKYQDHFLKSLEYNSSIKTYLEIKPEGSFHLKDVAIPSVVTVITSAITNAL